MLDLDYVKKYVSNSKFQFKKTKVISSYINYLNNLVVEVSRKQFENHCLNSQGHVQLSAIYK
jgi:hypothetical protein